MPYILKILKQSKKVIPVWQEVDLFGLTPKPLESIIYFAIISFFLSLISSSFVKSSSGFPLILLFVIHHSTFIIRL